ncbi:MAG: hypothetical protein VB100_13610 [Angelakisella sp.]|nr:hypothetical protein [Angelakisella sp.]
MKHLIQNMMTWFSVSEELLQIKGEVATPMGQMLYWDYYQYVKEHPVAGWDVPTKILYGSDDTLCERTIIDCFVVQFHCHLTVLEAGEHFFHTPAQLAHYEVWLKSSL